MPCTKQAVSFPIVPSLQVLKKMGGSPSGVLSWVTRLLGCLAMSGVPPLAASTSRSPDWHTPSLPPSLHSDLLNALTSPSTLLWRSLRTSKTPLQIQYKGCSLWVCTQVGARLEGRPNHPSKRSHNSLCSAFKEIFLHCYFLWGFPGGSEGKASAGNVGDPGSVPG